VRGGTPERKPGVWELRVVLGSDTIGKARHRNATFHGARGPPGGHWPD